MLHALEDGTFAPETALFGLFFELLLKNTVEGFFADPIYGGNQGKVGWRLTGFPGVPSGAYHTHMSRHGEPYRVEPVGIEDVVHGQVELDAEGLPRHRVVFPRK